MKNTLKIMCMLLSVAGASVHGINDENTPGIVKRASARLASAAGTGAGYVKSAGATTADYATWAGSWISWPFTTVWDWTYKPSAAYNAMKLYAGNHDLRAKNAKYADNYNADGSFKQKQAFFSSNGWLSLSLVKDTFKLAPARFFNEKAARYYAQYKGYDNDQTVKLMDKYSGWGAGLATTAAAAGLYYLYKKNVHGKIKNRAHNAFLSSYGVEKINDINASWQNWCGLSLNDIYVINPDCQKLKARITATLSQGTMAKDLVVDGANAVRNGFNSLVHEAQKAMNADKAAQLAVPVAHERKRVTAEDIAKLFDKLEAIEKDAQIEKRDHSVYAHQIAMQVNKAIHESGITMPVGYASVLEMYVKMHLITKNNQSEVVQQEAA
ncbi:hypothetical protein IPH25_04700 [bacterium]|nr:MAG: hypothetical protein IPG37_01695 [bacterium]QQR61739.1 MAG: hypothetical protein IPH25_04700 [bacterium]QQR62690.1 MAG: hypothetical protein IPH67_04720 [bacterium]